MILTTYVPKTVSKADFVSFWERQYEYPQEHLYSANIGHPLTPERVLQLFEWKNGSRLSARKLRSVEENYINRIHEVNTLPENTTPAGFLAQFATGGAIWRIFWLHCWQPNRFPIYDQHVHRAMVFIEKQRIEEIPTRDADKVRIYLEDYLQFHQEFSDLDQRTVDKSLWFYGKFVKSTQFPLAGIAC